MRGVVRVADDALDADNAFHFLLAPAEPVAVLLAAPATRGADDTYLRRALAIGAVAALRRDRGDASTR